MTRPVWIDADEIRKATPMADLVASLGRAFASQQTAPERTAYSRSPTSSLLLMPAWSQIAGSGVKIVDVDTNRRPAIHAIYVLFDSETGAPRAIMDGTMITARRTAAASALASQFLSRSDARCLLMIGTGALAPHLIEAHCSVRSFDSVAVWGRTPERADDVVARVSELGLEAHTVSDLDTEIARSCVVSVATSSVAPIVKGASLPDGCHLDLVGAFRPDMCEADSNAFRRARVFVDTMTAALTEAGDLIQAIKSGQFAPSGIESDLFGLCGGTHAGRDNDPRAITLFKSVGASIEDLACAELVLSRSVNRNALPT